MFIDCIGTFLRAKYKDTIHIVLILKTAQCGRWYPHGVGNAKAWMPGTAQLVT